MGLLMPNPKLTIAQNGRLWREVSLDPPPSLPASHILNKYRKRNSEGDSEHRKEWSTSTQSEIEVSGTVSDCDLDMSVITSSVVLTLCTYCSKGVPDSQTHSCKSWGISGERAGLQLEGSLLSTPDNKELRCFCWWYAQVSRKHLHFTSTDTHK